MQAAEAGGSQVLLHILLLRSSSFSCCLSADPNETHQDLRFESKSDHVVREERVLLPAATAGTHRRPGVEHGQGNRQE